MNEILEASKNYYNFEAAKKKENIIASRECRLFSDETELNKLEYTPSPKTPEYDMTKKCVPLSAGVFNMVRQLIP